jgi:hypothetical protein
MKFIHSQKSGNEAAASVFQISKQEVEWLLGVLKFYPQLDSDYHHITQGAAQEIKAEQQLLEEAMAQRRSEHKRKLEKFFATPGRFRLEAMDQYRFTLTAEQMEWLLQILNDVRVGCWVKLGRPELEPAPPEKLTAEEARTLSALEMSGFFQMVLLGAYEGPEPEPA